MLNKSDSKSFVRFIVIGAISTSIDFLIYLLLSRYIHVLIAKSISMLIASVFSFIFNKNWTFNNNDKSNINIIIRFYLVLLINILCNATINYLILRIYDNKYIAFVIATGISMILNYLLQRKFVFGKE